MDGPSLFTLKYLAKMSLIENDWALARKYFHILHQAPFEGEFLAKYEPMLDRPDLVQADPEFAGVLKQYPDIDVAIYGHTDSTGTDAINVPLSLARAKSVSGYLESCGISNTKFKSIEGQGSSQPVATNATKEGRAQNRRVEVYMYASAEMIKAAEAGTLN